MASALPIPAERDPDRMIRGEVRRGRTLGPPGFLRPARWEQVLVPVATAVVAAGSLFNGFNSFLGAAVAAFVGCLLLAFQLALQPPSLTLWRGLAPPLLAALAAVVWVVIGPGVVPGAAPWLAPDLVEPKLLGFAAGLAALLSGALLALRPRRIPTAVDFLIVFLTATLVLGLALRAFDIDDTIWQPVWHRRFAGTIGNANVTAAVAGMTTLLALGQLLMHVSRRRHRRRAADTVRTAVYAFAMLIGMGAAIATASRFVFVGTLGLIAPYAIWGWLRHRRRRTAISSGALLIGVAGAGLVIFALVQSNDLVLQRFSQLAHEFGLRQLIWRTYLALALEQPLTGYGPGAFSVLNEHRLSDPAIANLLWSVNSPHNLLLQLMLNGGVPYLLLIAAAALWIAVAIVRHWRRWQIGDIGVVLAIVLAVGCAMVDIALDVPGVVVLTLFLAGLLWGRALAPVEIVEPSAHRSPA